MEMEQDQEEAAREQEEAWAVVVEDVAEWVVIDPVQDPVVIVFAPTLTVAQKCLIKQVPLVII